MMYDRKLSLSLCMMLLKAAIQTGCLLLAVKYVVSRLQKLVYDLMQLSRRSLDHNLAGPSSVNANSLNLEASLVS